MPTTSPTDPAWTATSWTPPNRNSTPDQLNSANIFIRQQPWYKAFFAQIGQDPNRASLSDAQRQQLLQLAAKNGFDLRNTDGMNFDPAGNVNTPHGFASQPTWLKGVEIAGTAAAGGVGAGALLGAGGAGASGAAGADAAAGASGAAAAPGAVDGASWLASATVPEGSAAGFDAASLGIPAAAADGAPAAAGASWLTDAGYGTGMGTAPTDVSGAAASDVAGAGADGAATDTLTGTSYGSGAGANPTDVSGAAGSDIAGAGAATGLGTDLAGAGGSSLLSKLLKYGAPAAGTAIQQLLANRRANAQTGLAESTLDPYRGQMAQANDLSRLNWMADQNNQTPAVSLDSKYGSGVTLPPAQDYSPSPATRAALRAASGSIAAGNAAPQISPGAKPLPKLTLKAGADPNDPASWLTA
jgi:hypothetical protein